jgi:hypothetical protein
MFNDLNWGGYLALNLFPTHKTFVDSVSDVSGEVTLEYETVITLAPGWQEILRKYAVDWVIIPADSMLAEQLTAQGWHLRYVDATAVILQK